MVAGKIIRILSEDEIYQKECYELCAGAEDTTMITKPKVCDFCCRVVESLSYCMLCKKQQNFNKMKLCDICFADHMVHHANSGCPLDKLTVDGDCELLCKLTAKEPTNLSIF
tara:strand:+ start:214 stop:549 length:336 start_codon:yes stop_codon:yes gene_type:complete